MSLQEVLRVSKKKLILKLLSRKRNKNKMKINLKNFLKRRDKLKKKKENSI